MFEDVSYAFKIFVIEVVKLLQLRTAKYLMYIFSFQFFYIACTNVFQGLKLRLGIRYFYCAIYITKYEILCKLQNVILA